MAPACLPLHEWSGMAAPHGVPRRSEDTEPPAWDGHWFRPTRTAFTAHRVPSRRPPHTAEASWLALHALPRPFRGLARAPAGRPAHSRSHVRTDPLPLLDFLALRHMSTRWCARWRRFRRRRQPRAGFGYPHRGPHHAVLRPPTPFEVTRLPTPRGCRSAHGLSPSRAFPRTRSVLLSKSVPSCRFHAPKPHPWMEAKTRSRLQGVCSRAESVRDG